MNGEWVESKEEIEIQPTGGAAALQGQHQVYFPYDIYDGVIEVVTPDGEHLKSRPLGVSYYDGTNSVMVGELRHSVGQILPSGNQVIYTNCFTDFAADLVCTYRKSGFESDVVFRGRPLAPEAFGLKSQLCRLELLTEFFDTPDPVIKPQTNVLNQLSPSGSSQSAALLSNAESTDSTLKFGAMAMIRGKAFAVQGNNQTNANQNQSASSPAGPIPVCKTWSQINGRKFLIESVPVLGINNQFNVLPAANQSVARIQSAVRRSSSLRLLPPRRIAQSQTNIVQFAKANLVQNPGVVLDYNEIDENESDYTFQSNTTYYVSSYVYFAGDTIIQGGAVIKYAAGAALDQTSGAVICETSAERPAVLTAVDDDSVGEIIAGVSTGAPTGYYAYYGFFLDNFDTSQFGYLNIYYASNGLAPNISPVIVHGCQFFNTGVAIAQQGGFVNAENDLFYNVDTVFGLGGSGDSVAANFITVHNANTLVASDPTLYATNCLFVSVTNWGASIDGENNESNSSDSGIFATRARASHYLASSSPYRDAGTTATDPDLLSEIETKTTYSPQDGSYADNDGYPDLGFHYPVDEDSDYDGVPDSDEDATSVRIIFQPQGQEVPQGQDVIFSVTPGGTPPFGYQWKFNGNSIAGATTYRYTNFVVTIDDEGDYSVTVTNATSSVTSSSAVLMVDVPLSVDTPPQDQVVLEGANGTFSIHVTGNYPVYQWYADGVPLNNGTHIAGANSSSLTISNATLSDEHRYWCVISNLFDTVSSPGANLIVIPKPGIVSAPTNVVAIQSDDVTLSDVISGNGLYYQWWLTNSLVTNSIPGATNSSYTKLVVRTNDAGSYSLVITNIAGSTNANTKLIILVPPWIVQQPASVVTNQGDNVTFSISATGTTNLFYQWFKNGTNSIANATNASFTINNVQAADAAGYSVVVTNIAGTNVSAWAWLSVNLTGGGTTNGWGGGGSPPSSGITISMIGPTNSSPTNPAVHLYGPAISIRASASSTYNYITNVAFYFTGTNYGTNFMLAGEALPGANTKFALEWTNSIPGTNILKARAWDNKGNTNDSDVVYVIMDQPPQIDLSVPVVSLVWEGGPVSTWLTNYITDDGMPYGITNYSWTLQSDTAVSNIYIYTGTNVILATHVTFSDWGAYQMLLYASDGFVTNMVDQWVDVFHHPTVSFNTPTNGETIPNGDPILLDVTATAVSGVITNVAFYNGSATIDDGVQSVGGLYRYYWTNAPPGPRTLTAIAWNNVGLTATDTVSTIVVTPTFSVNFVSPTNTQFFAFSPTNLLLTAFVSPGSNGTVTNVVFTNVTQSQLIGTGTLTDSTYQTLWTNVTDGTHTISVTARDDAGNVSTQQISITNNTMPIVSIISPTNIQSFSDGANVTLTALASDGEDGTNVSVSFYYTNSLIDFASHVGGATNSLVWNSRSSGTYTVVAVATDSRGASSASAPAVFRVNPATPFPSVSITYPTNGSSFVPGSDITITATATNYPTSVTNVEFFVDGTSIGSDSDIPYSITKCCWEQGTYVLIAVATDSAGTSTKSDPITITIPNAPISGRGFWDQVFGLSATTNFEDAADFQNTSIAVSTNGTIYTANDEDAFLEFTTNGMDWHLAGQSSNSVYAYWACLFTDGTNVYGSGDLFGPDDGSFVADDYGIVKWDTISWSPVGDGLKDTEHEVSWAGGVTVYAIAKVGGDIYVGGTFDSAGGIGSTENTNIQRIAKLDPVTGHWVQVGNGITNGVVYTIAAVDGELYIGGTFTNAGGNPKANYIARLDNNTWTNLGLGLVIPDFSICGGDIVGLGVRAMQACGNKLFVGGNFISAGGNTNASGIAVWDGKNWEALGSGIAPSVVLAPEIGCEAPYVTTLAVHGNQVFVGGSFSGTADGAITSPGIIMATWNEAENTWTWSDLDSGTVWNWVTRCQIVNGPSADAFDLYISGSFADVGSDGIPSWLVARWRVGSPAPALPTIAITSPTNETGYSVAPTNIEIDATATSASTNIDSTTFYVDGASIGSGTVDGAHGYKINWSLSAGIHALTAVAVDSNGLQSRSKPVFVYVAGSDTVTAADDSYSLIVGGPSTTSLDVLSNDSTSTGHPLQIVGVTHGINWLSRDNVGTPEIGFDGTSIKYTLYPNTYGTDRFLYYVTDGVSTNSAYVTVKARVKPQILFEHPVDGSTNIAGANIPFNGVMFDLDSSITNLSIYVNGNLVNQSEPTPIGYQTHPTNFFFTFPSNAISPETTYSLFTNNWTTTGAGYYTFLAVGIDTYGYSNISSPVTIVLTNPSTATNILIAAITNLPVSYTANGTPQYSSIRTGSFNLQGTAWDSNTNDVVSYKVLVHPRGDLDTIIGDVTPQIRDGTGSHTGRVSNASLGTCDFSQIQNGVYDLELIVKGGGSETNAVVTFQLESDLKIGQFSFSEQDLVLPVNGIPLTVTRTYNSLNPDSGPFGTSWSFALNDMDVKLDDERTDVAIGSDNAPFDEDDDTSGGALPKILSMRTGGNWDVTLTLPDGRRTTFMFGYDGAWPTLHAKWTPQAGITAKLEPADIQDSEIDFGYSGLSVPVWKGSDFTSGYAPFENQDFPGWVLTTADGTKYHISRGRADNVICLDPNGSGKYISARVYGPPKLTEIDELSTNKIVINNDGLFNYDPTNALTRWTLFERDNAGRITALRDPNGGSNGLPAVKYVYDDDTGNLIQVLKLVDRNAGTYTTNKYHYENVNFPHYITSIENGDSIPVARNLYDDNGRLTAVRDAHGTLTQFNHSLTNNSEVVIDRLNHTNTYVYDLQGNVIWATNALGEVTATAYTNSTFTTLKTAETNAYGTAQATWTVYIYDDKGNQTNVVSMGHTNSFVFDGAGNLLTQTDPLGNMTRNLYDEVGNLTNTAQYDAHNNLIQQSSSVYENGKLIRTLNGNGQVTATFDYDEFGNLTNTADANGFSRDFSYDADGNQTGSSYTWTPLGGSSTTVTTTTKYDAQNRVIETVDALGNTNSTFYNALGKVDYTVDKFGGTNSFLYDAPGNLIQTTYPNGTFTRTAYDAAGRPYFALDRNAVSGTRTDYDAEGRATNTVRLTNVVINITYSGSVAQSEVISEGVPISTNSTVYDAAGRVTSRTNPDGTTTYEYYPDGQLERVIDALNNTNFYAYDAAGRQTNVVDALNHSTKFQYDAVGRMVATIYDDTTATTNLFDNLGQRTGVVDQAKRLTQFGYNLSGQLTNVIKPAVPDPDHSGTLTPAQWVYLYDSYGHPTATIDPKGRGTTNFFDAYSRQFSQRLAMNQTNLVEYNSLGQVVTNFDFKGQWTKFVYDQYGRTKAKFFFTSDNHLSNSVCYQYNDLDQITKITERYGDDAATNSCDGYLALVGPLADWPTESSSEASKTWAAITTTAPKWGAPLAALAALYFLLSLPAGRKVREILDWYYLCDGWRVNYVAAVSERRTKRLRLPSFFWRAATIITITALIVDDPGWDNLYTARADCSYPANESTDLTRITSYVYDFDGRVTQVNSPEGVINYDYNLATGRLLSTCTTNSYVTNSYDALGRLKTVTVLKRNGSDLPAPEVTTNSYDNVGNRSEVDLPNGIVTKYMYDDLNRLTNMTHDWGTTNLATYTYKLDATGRRTNAVEILRIPAGEGGGYFTNTLSWQFDGMYRLTNEVNLCSVAGASYTNAYVYDLVGNRFSHTITASNSLVVITNSYNANDELLAEVTKSGSLYTQTNTYGYDTNGSLIGLTNSAASGLSTNVYTYNLMNKLSGVTSGTSTAMFQYNDQGIRVRTMGASTKYYLIDANNNTGYQQVLEEFAALRTTPTRSYVIGDDVLAQADSGSASYLLYDGHGSTRQIADNNATVTSRYSYDAYGNVRDYTSSPIAESTRTSVLYCGEQYDSTLQMYNLRARYYGPSNGRFNQRDTFEGNNEDPQSLHKYTYANADPANGIDPSGNLTMIEILIVVGVLLSISFAFYDGLSAVRDYQRGDYQAYFRDEAWTMVDLASLLEPGGGFLDGGAKVAYEGARAAESATSLLRAKVPAASVWGYVRAMASMISGGGKSGSTSSSKSSSNSPDGPGTWQKEDQSSWPKGAEEYQWQVTGRQGWCYDYNGVRFDGWDSARKVLLEAKRGYAWQLEPWAKKIDFASIWRKWAQRRVTAAGGIPVEARFSVKGVADLVRDATEGTGIKIIYEPETTVIQ